MNRRNLIPLTATLTAVAFVLVGCAPSNPTPTHSTKASATATPTPTPTVGAMAPPQPQVDPPTSADDAKTAAVKTINLYLHYGFILQEHPELGGNYLYNYVTDNAQTIAQNTSTYDISHKIRASGGPVVFSPNYGLSYTGQTTGPNNAIYNDGVAYMIGCADNSATLVSTNGAAPTPHTPATFPDQFTVEWNAHDRVWLVTDLSDLTGQVGAPKC